MGEVWRQSGIRGIEVAFVKGMLLKKSGDNETLCEMPKFGQRKLVARNVKMRKKEGVHVSIQLIWLKCLFTIDSLA